MTPFATVTIDTGSQTISAVQDLLEVSLPTDLIAEVTNIEFTQSSDYGDSQAEGLRLQLKRGAGTTSGSGGGSATVSAHQTGQGAHGLTAERNNTTQAVVGGGSLDTLFDKGFNIQVGCFYLPPPEQRFWFSPGEEIYVSLPAAPSDAITGSCQMVLNLYGG